MGEARRGSAGLGRAGLGPTRHGETRHGGTGRGRARLSKAGMEQTSFNWQQQAIQPRELSRCRAVVAPLILAFWRERGVGTRFHMAELTEYVRSQTMIAPDSAGRILRDMRQAGELNYAVIDRRKSLYEIQATESRQ